jgi:pimeloyl-ACP methyl ester carboxylesterase
MEGEMPFYSYMSQIPVKVRASAFPVRPLLAAALGALAAATPAAAAPAPPLSLAPCKVAGIEREVKCGRFEVYEDRAKAAGRKISLRVVVVPATGPGHEPDPVFVFEGGPGESAVESAPGEAQAGAELNRKRDFVMVDVRGTGDSNGLRCEALRGHKGVLGYMESFLPVDGVRACRQELAGRADLTLYTTTLAVDDVDDVRAALGYDRINIEGGSYGTFAALNYMRRHPEHVRTAVLQGIVPPDTRMPLSFARYAQTALDQVIAACARDTACHAAFPDTAGDVRDVLARLEKHPVDVVVKDSETGKPVTVTLGRSAAAQTIRYMLYVPITAAQISLQAHMAAQGDFSRLAETAYMFGSFVTSMSDGFYLSVTCAEDLPLFTLGAAEEAARGTFLGDFRARVQKAACAEWPQGKTPAGFTDPVRSEAPTLLMSGERDPVTPSSSGDLAARTLPHSKHIVVPGGGHGYDGEKGLECLDRIATAFVERGSEKDLDTSCVAKIEPVPFALRDDRAAEVALTPAELDRFAGVYAGPHGDELTVRREGANLQLATGQGNAVLLTAIGPARFRVEGAPPGFFVEFQSEGAAVTALRMEQGPNDVETLKRKP